MGGVARRATLIERIRSENQNVLLLDAGNSLVAESAAESDPALRTRGQTSVEVLNRLAYDAAAVGPIDLLLGRTDLMARVGEAKGFNWLSANLSDPATGRALLPSSVIKEMGGHRIALIGITGPITGTLTGRVPEFAVTDPLEAARQAVQEVSSKADIIILLSSAGAQLNQKIGAEVPGIDIILSAGSDPLSAPVQIPDGPLVVQADQSSAGHAGRVVGILKASFGTGGKLASYEWQAISLDPNIVDDPDMATWVTEITATTTATP